MTLQSSAKFRRCDLNMSSVSKLKDIGECVICAGTFVDPRVLPCGHTFCLQCISRWMRSAAERNHIDGEAEPADEEVEGGGLHGGSCPECRSPFRGSATELTRNIFAERLLEVHRTAAGKIGTPRSSLSVSDTTDRRVRRDASDWRRIRDETRSVSVRLAELWKNKLLKAERKRTEFVESTGIIEADIRRRVEILKTRLERDEAKLIGELTDLRRNGLKRFNLETTELESRVAQLESFRRQTEWLAERQGQTDQEMTLEWSRRHSELLGIKSGDTLEDQEVDFATEINFESSADGAGNVVGKLTTRQVRVDFTGPGPDEAVASEKAAAPHVVSSCGGSQVLAMTSLGPHLYAVRHNIAEIERYDAQSLQLVGCLPVSGLGPWPYGLTSVSVAGHVTLYVSDYAYNVIRGVEQLKCKSAEANVTQSKWPVGRQPTGLSTTPSQQTLLVACQYSSKIQELELCSGRILRQHRLPSTLERPWQAVTLSRQPRLVVVSSLSSRSVALLDVVSGDVVGQLDGLKFPRALTLTDEGQILIADQMDNSLMLADERLEQKRKLALGCSTDGVGKDCGCGDVEVEDGAGFCEPFAVCVEGQRLFVGEYSSGRIIAVTNFTSI